MLANSVDISLSRIEIGSWVLLLILSVAGWAVFSAFAAKSILVGGILANVGFWWLKRDLGKLFKGSLQGVKALFFVRYYARFSALAVILFLLVNYRLVHIVGLLVGLSTVLLSIGVITAGEAKKIFLDVKEAS